MTTGQQDWEAWERWGLPAGGREGEERLPDFNKWVEYGKRGGLLGYRDWVDAGKPASQIEEVQARVTGRMEAEQAELTKAETEARGEGVPPTGFEMPEPPPFPTESPPEGYVWQLNEFNQWAPVYRGAEGPPTYGAPGEAPTGPFGRNAVWNERTGQWEYPPLWGIDPETLERGYIDPAEQARLAFQQQQATQQAAQWQQQQAQQQQQFQTQQAFQQEQLQAEQAEAERQERARLGTQPVSWLQYAEYTGEQPVVQPWMLPLMSQQYQTQAGQPIPGWGGEMPQLTRPGAQYWARMGPTAQQQYAGYRQHRTGARPEETAFRQEAAAPPGGASRLRWAR